MAETGTTEGGRFEGPPDSSQVEPSGDGSSSSELPTSGVLVPPDSDTKPEISFVMPTKNEEESVGPCIRQAKEALQTLGVNGEIIISDNSTDRTAEIASEHGARVVEPDKLGYGYAYRYAFERVQGNFVVIGDADMTYDFKELPRLFRAATYEEADMVIGSRFQGQILPGSMPALHRYVGNPLLTWVLNALYGIGISDAHSGFRLLSRDALEILDLESDGMEFASEMIIEAKRQGLTIREVPISYHTRKGDATLNSFRDGWRHVALMLQKW